MPKARLGIATGNVPAQKAACAVARSGGNAVDACLTAAVMSWVAEPFFASIGGSGFVAVRSPDGTVEVFDGNNAMPTLPADQDGGPTRVYLDYSNGMYTGIGGAAVAVPGVLAAVEAAWQRHGSIEWPALFADAIAAARGGIVFPRTSAYYLSVTWEPIWSRYAEARALFGRERPVVEGDPLVQPALADALELVAQQGASALYGGSLGRALADAVARDGGHLSMGDLVGYEAQRRDPVRTELWGWRVESTPPPALGGAMLVHMLSALAEADLDDAVDRLRAVIEAEQAAMGYRSKRYEDPGDVVGAVEGRERPLRARSAATTHASAADADGVVCAVTESNGYGAGLIVAGMLLNNTLGEEELNPLGPHHLSPGARCHSNMAPTVATGPDRVVGLGSPGADRIVGAIAQTLIALALDGADLQAAVAAPRAHLATRPEGPLLCFEPGLPGNVLGWTARPYDDLHMFFGAVQAASVDRYGRVAAAYDPRRSGGSAVV
jgi:gamma-glutamyltranspeptidase/glutathione hydrolase